MISNVGAKHFAEALTHSNCKLNSLNLSSRLILDEDVKHLDEALNHSNCKLLNSPTVSPYSSIDSDTEDSEDIDLVELVASSSY